MEGKLMLKPDGVGINKIPVGRLVEFGLANKYLTEDDFYGGVPMLGGLLPDWAIREFVTIDDFVDYHQCPRDVVSYGLTSAGYDVRVGGHFKVFTNANCETVRPGKIPDDAFLNKDLTGHTWVRVPNEKKAICAQCSVAINTNVARLKCPVPAADTPDVIKIPPNSFALAETVEKLYIPRNINCLCLGKSTYARCGIIMNFTPFEPGWYGVVTVEITNSTPLPVAIKAYQGIGQAQFQLMVAPCQVSYGEKKNAKYQGQTGLTLPSVA